MVRKTHSPNFEIFINRSLNIEAVEASPTTITNTNSTEKPHADVTAQNSASPSKAAKSRKRRSSSNSTTSSTSAATPQPEVYKSTEKGSAKRKRSPGKGHYEKVNDSDSGAGVSPVRAKKRSRREDSSSSSAESKEATDQPTQSSEGEEKLQPGELDIWVENKKYKGVYNISFNREKDGLKRECVV